MESESKTKELEAVSFYGKNIVRLSFSDNTWEEYRHAGRQVIDVLMQELSAKSAALDQAEKRIAEADVLYNKYFIESDESCTECIERTIEGWKQRAIKAEKRMTELVESMPITKVCCQDFNNCDELCRPLVHALRGRIAELEATIRKLETA